MQRDDKQRFWFDHIEAWQQSGLTQRRYCEDHELSFYTFQYWRAKHRNPTSEADGTQQVVPVSLADRQRGDSTGIRLWLANGVELAVAPEFDPATLRSVVKALQG